MLTMFQIAYAESYQQQQKNISFTGIRRTTILQSKNKVELFRKNLIDQARAEQSPSIQEN